MGGKLGRGTATSFWLLLLLVEKAITQMETEAEYPGLCPLRGNEACNGRLVMSLCHTLLAHQESDLPQYCNRHGNSHSYEITTFTPEELTPEILQRFRTTTAEALNRFCSQRVCIVDEQNVTDLQVLPENVFVPLSTIWTDSAGNPVLMFYVQMTDNTFVSEETLQLAIESADDMYRETGFLEKLSGLRLWFTNDSPIVSGRDVTAYIHVESSDQVAMMTCRMTGQSDVDCSSGVVHYSSLTTHDVNEAYTLTVEATTNDGRMYEISRQLRIEEPGYCTVHLINNGVTVHDGKVTIEFAPTGYTVSTACILDPPKTKDNRFFDCSSPVTMEVTPGRHKFKVTPRGCYDYRFPVKVEFEVPEK